MLDDFLFVEEHGDGYLERGGVFCDWTRDDASYQERWQELITWGKLTETLQQGLK